MIHKSFSDLISIENLFQAWSEFKVGKRKRKDVQIFERNLEDNLFDLHLKLKNREYKHGQYQSFFVYDPKLRHIHKASVADRIVHRLLYKYLYELFDKSFIYDSYSCRLEKGTHKAVKRLEKFTRTVSKNYTKPCWALKLDIRKFFASVDHRILLGLLNRKIKEENTLWLLTQVIESFTSSDYQAMPGLLRPRSEASEAKGIPLGNLTSQIFANIYMNELDQFVKHEKIKYYIRYADDFLILSPSENDLNHLIKSIEIFLMEKLKLELHPKKIILRRLDFGIDFLGYIVLPRYLLPRTKTKRRMFKKLEEKKHLPNFNEYLQSYLGYLSHASAYKLSEQLKNQLWYNFGCYEMENFS